MRYLVIGGWAAIAHGLPRTTLDVDLFIEPTPENVQRLINALSQVGFGIARELTPGEILSRKAFLFQDQIKIDLFTQPWRLESFEDAYARRWEADFDSTRIPFVSIEDLILTKQTGREQDQADLKSLRELASRRPGGQSPLK